MPISVLIPCYNEAPTLGRVVAAVLAGPVEVLEVVVVDDGSTDDLAAVLAALPPERVRVLRHARNRGKGAAVRTGLAEVRGEIVVIQDADLEYSPQDYPRLLAPLLEGAADVVYGSRFAGGQAHRVLFFWHSVANRLLTLFSNMLTNLNLTDMETGSKAFRTEVLRAVPLREDRFGFEPEVTARLARRGARFFEVGVSYHGRTYAEGKKVGLKDAFRACWVILKTNLLPGA